MNDIFTNLLQLEVSTNAGRSVWSNTANVVHAAVLARRLTDSAPTLVAVNWPQLPESAIASAIGSVHAELIRSSYERRNEL